MARAKDLAGLAALGALGYMLTRGKGEDSNPTRGAGYQSTETREKSAGDKAVADTNSSVLTALQKPRNIREEGIAAANDVRAPAMAGRLSPAAVVDNTTNIAMPSQRQPQQPLRDREAGASRGTISKAVRQQQLSTRKLAPSRDLASQMRRPPSAESEAIEAVYPEQYMTPGGGFKTVATAARNLANRGAVSAAERTAPALKEIGMDARAARLGAPTKQLTGPSKAELVARDRAARAAARQEQMLQENAANYGLNPNAPGYQGAAGAVRSKLGGDEFTIMKKGGKVKKMASGGATRSASARADGAAQRGKTKCKMY